MVNLPEKLTFWHSDSNSDWLVLHHDHHELHAMLVRVTLKSKGHDQINFTGYAVPEFRENGERLLHSSSGRVGNSASSRGHLVIMTPSWIIHVPHSCYYKVWDQMNSKIVVLWPDTLHGGGRSRGGGGGGGGGGGAGSPPPPPLEKIFVNF